MWPLEHTQAKMLTMQDGRKTMHDRHDTITVAHSVLRRTKKIRIFVGHYPVLDNNISDWSRLRAAADNKLNMSQGHMIQ